MSWETANRLTRTGIFVLLFSVWIIGNVGSAILMGFVGFEAGVPHGIVMALAPMIQMYAITPEIVGFLKKKLKLEG